MGSKPVKNYNKLNNRKRRSAHDLYFHCSFVLKRLVNRKQNFTTYLLFEDLYKIGQKTRQTGLRYKYNLLDAIDLLIRGDLVVKEKKGIQRELIVATKLGRDIGMLLINIDRFKLSYQDLKQNNESIDKSVYRNGKAPNQISSQERSSLTESRFIKNRTYNWDLDELKANALSHFVKIIFMKFHLVNSENDLNEVTKSLLKEIMSAASNLHSTMLSEYLKESSEYLKESPEVKGFDSQVDPAIHKVIYDLFGPLNSEELAKVGVKTLHSLLSIIGLSNEELIQKVLEDKRSFSTIIEMGFAEVTRDYSNKDPKVQLSLYKKLLNNINTFQV